jgi:SAM-dependent methyltransferase
MIAYEFYHKDEMDNSHLIGILPERRKNPGRITNQSILNLVKKWIDDDTAISHVLFSKIILEESEDKKWEEIQRSHYDKIGYKYELHYSDECSQRYRKLFINEPMVEGVDLSHLNVLEAMSGSGQTTQFLSERGAKVTGLDISPKSIGRFLKRSPNCRAICASIFNTKIRDHSFDCVVIVGGLHHLHPRVNEAVDEIYRILKPGGYFLFMEPHNRSFLNLFRKLWYKFDNLFQKMKGQ